VQIFVESRIREVQRTSDFAVRTESGEFHAPTLVVATGGLSIPKMGATPFGYQLARQFGLNIVETKPALVPFVLAGKDRSQYCDLAGVSADVHAKANHHAFREKMLINPSRLERAGDPANLFLLEKGQFIQIDLAPDHEIAPAIRRGQGTQYRRGAKGVFRESCRSDSPNAGWKTIRQRPGTMLPW